MSVESSSMLTTSISSSSARGTGCEGTRRGGATTGAGSSFFFGFFLGLRMFTFGCACCVVVPFATVLSVEAACVVVDDVVDDVVVVVTLDGGRATFESSDGLRGRFVLSMGVMCEKLPLRFLGEGDGCVAGGLGDISSAASSAVGNLSSDDVQIVMSVLAASTSASSPAAAAAAAGCCSTTAAVASVTASVVAATADSSPLPLFIPEVNCIGSAEDTEGCVWEVAAEAGATVGVLG